MLAALGEELRDQPSAARDDDRAMPFGDQRAADLQGRALGAAGFERGYQLYDGQAAVVHARAVQATST